MNEISQVNGIFTTKKLAEFKGAEVKEGEFLVRKIEKGTGLASLGCVIPAVTQEGFVSALENTSVFNAAIEWFQSSWNDALKLRLEEGKNLYLADLDLATLVEFFDAKEVSEGRVSKEKISGWFDSEVAKVLHRAFAEKLGNIDNDKMVEILKSYKIQFMNLAKREITLAGPVKVNLEKAISLLPASSMKDYCEKKIKSSEEKSADLMAL